MKANELRIGNIVSRKFFNPNPKNPAYEYENCIVKGIGFEKVNVTTGLNRNEILKLDYESLKPVDLSKFWFQKFGFTESENYWHTKKAFPSIEEISIKVNMESNATVIFGEEMLEPSFLYELKYVHQLQNLYYSLTGKVLE